MIITKPEVEPDGLYNQGQAAKALHVDRHTVAGTLTMGLLSSELEKPEKA